MPRTYAIFGGSLVEWQGGRWFLRLIVRAMAEHCRGGAGRIVLVLPRSSSAGNALRIAGWCWAAARELLQSGRPAPLLLNSTSRELLDSISAGIEGPIEVVHCAPSRGSLIEALRRAEAKVLLPSAAVWRGGLPIPWVGYVPDLQHRHLPELFTPAEIRYRDGAFQAMLASAPAVIVNSNAVKEDLARFFPDPRARIFALPFAPLLESGGASPAAEVLARYGIKPAFFMVSNQFWVHKNHGVAFRALKRLMESTGRADLSLVCTGETGDYRARAHFSSLLAELSALGVVQNVRILGLIPRGDYLALMSAAVAVVQPTLFEGGPGGGAVYDAVALGVRSIVSDIPVNREIDAEDAVFFPPHDDRALAALMAEALRAHHARPAAETLHRRSTQRAERLGGRLAEAADFAISAHAGA
jgi:glycosyltransferase involved in cell wall biosynthesis